MAATTPTGVCDSSMGNAACWAAGKVLAPLHAATSVAQGAVSVAHGAVAAGNFMAHPLASTDRALQKCTSALVSTVLPALEKVTRPDLSRAWFVHAYQGAFAIALLAFVVLVGWNLLARARGRIGSDELVESLVLYGPLFLIGATFAPAGGAFLLRFTGALTDSVCSFFGTGGTPTGSTSRLQELITAANPDGITGGAVVAILFLVALLLALIGVFGVLLVMSVTLYLSAVIAPLSFVWLVHPHRRGRGVKVLNVWIGICFAHVLLFFLLGAVFSMFTDLPFTRGVAVGAGTTAAGATAAAPHNAGPFAELVALAVAVIALFMAVLSPLGLLKFAPVAPTTAGAAGAAAGGGGGGGRGLPGQRNTRGGRGAAGGNPAASGLTETGTTGGGGGGPGAVIGGAGGGGLRPTPAMASAAATRSARGAGSASGGAGAASGGAGAAAAGGAGAGAAGAGAAAAAGPVGAGLVVAAKVTGKARAAAESAAGHMGHADAHHGAGEGLRPRHR